MKKNRIIALAFIAIVTNMTLVHAQNLNYDESAAVDTFAQGLNEHLDSSKTSTSSYDYSTLIAQIQTYIEKAKENPFLKTIIEKIEAIFHKIIGDPQAFLNDPKAFIQEHYNDQL